MKTGRIERWSEWRTVGEHSYALGRDGDEQLLLRRRPEADGPRVEVTACGGAWPGGAKLPGHDPRGWRTAMLASTGRAA